MVIGALCSFLGGYIAARLARHDEKLNGTVSSVLSLASGIIAIAIGHNPDQLVIQIVSLPLKPLFGFAGGAFRLAQVRAKPLLRGDARHRRSHGFAAATGGHCDRMRRPANPRKRRR